MEQNITWERGEYWVTTDKTKCDIHFVHNNLKKLPWAIDVEFERVKISIEHSICFTLFHRDKEIGFARLLTDFATFAYLADVFVIDEYQKRGLGRWLVECILKHPVTSYVKHVALVTYDAPWLYKKVGFQAVVEPDFVWMLDNTKPSE
ncbi:GNAT family N-acetyltransferase [Xenorhabdus sp. 12]|uniref:GNAT family N-acetyltransferase n=1 Tax=Xenorhabdus santafensis TaxID=2582833 RepID=A0ABU4SAL8_9GAMM|nr:GNAT family N-acetyltransferase [Xenorhabdus sp. 12]MDX7987796.1 GNAT family N-acetyltransferase [Xenorhabdus sp. 12]